MHFILVFLDWFLYHAKEMILSLLLHYVTTYVTDSSLLH
jgi:hypothetical protein